MSAGVNLVFYAVRRRNIMTDNMVGGSQDVVAIFGRNLMWEGLLSYAAASH